MTRLMPGAHGLHKPGMHGSATPSKAPNAKRSTGHLTQHVQYTRYALQRKVKPGRRSARQTHGENNAQNTWACRPRKYLNCRLEARSLSNNALSSSPAPAHYPFGTHPVPVQCMPSTQNVPSCPRLVPVGARTQDNRACACQVCSATPSHARPPECRAKNGNFSAQNIQDTARCHEYLLCRLQAPTSCSRTSHPPEAKHT